MIQEITSSITSLKEAKNIISTLLGIRDFAKYAPQINELNKQIIEAYDIIFAGKEHISSLIAKIAELEKECIRLKDWSTEKEQYERREIALGNFAYIDKKHTGSFESAHKLCCNCFDQTIPSTLQQTVLPPTFGITQIILNCSNRNCGARLIFNRYIS